MKTQVAQGDNTGRRTGTMDIRATAGLLEPGNATVV